MTQPDYFTVTIAGDGSSFHVHAKGEQLEDWTDRYDLEFVAFPDGRTGFVLATKEPAIAPYTERENVESCL